MNNKIALSLSEVSFSHEKGKALNEATLDFQKGKTTVILGPNGAGKSILLKLCHGLLTPTSGNIITHEGYSRSAMVFPKPIFLRRTVLQNMIYVLDALDIDTKAKVSIAQEALKKFAMEKFADSPARLLSSGEKQRLSLIRALLLNPDILYLDEPTANLDPHATRLLENMVAESHENKTTIIMATHDLMQAKRIAEQVIFIENGTIMETSNTSNFFKNPKTIQARNFVEGKLY